MKIEQKSSKVGGPGRAGLIQKKRYELCVSECVWVTCEQERGKPIIK